MHIATRRLVLSLLLLGTAAAQAAPASPEPSPRERLSAVILDGLAWPERIEVRGRILVVEELVRAARENGTDEADVARRVADEVLLTVLTDELHRTNAWLSDDKYEEAYAAYAKEYDETPFTVAVIATRFKLYPDLATFQRRWRILESFAQAHKVHEADQAQIVEQATISNDYLGGATLDVELWFHEAPVGKNGRRNFTAAAQEAAKSLEHLQAGKDAADLPANVRHLRPGDGKPVHTNPLRTALNEGEYTALHRTYATDKLLAATPGSLLGPLFGTNGVYVARLIRKQTGKQTLDPTVPNVAKLLRALLLERRFYAWVEEVVRHAGIRVDGQLLVPEASSGSSGVRKL